MKTNIDFRSALFGAVIGGAALFAIGAATEDALPIRQVQVINAPLDVAVRPVPWEYTIVDGSEGAGKWQEIPAKAKEGWEFVGQVGLEPESLALVFRRPLASP